MASFTLTLSEAYIPTSLVFATGPPPAPATHTIPISINTQTPANTARSSSTSAETTAAMHTHLTFSPQIIAGITIACIIVATTIALMIGCLLSCTNRRRNSCSRGHTINDLATGTLSSDLSSPVAAVFNIPEHENDQQGKRPIHMMTNNSRQQTYSSSPVTRFGTPGTPSRLVADKRVPGSRGAWATPTSLVGKSRSSGQYQLKSSTIWENIDGDSPASHASNGSTEKLLPLRPVEQLRERFERGRQRGSEHERWLKGAQHTEDTMSCTWDGRTGTRSMPGPVVHSTPTRSLLNDQQPPPIVPGHTPKSRIRQAPPALRIVAPAANHPAIATHSASSAETGLLHTYHLPIPLSGSTTTPTSPLRLQPPGSFYSHPSHTHLLPTANQVSSILPPIIYSQSPQITQPLPNATHHSLSPYSHHLSKYTPSPELYRLPFPYPPTPSTAIHMPSSPSPSSHNTLRRSSLSYLPAYYTHRSYFPISPPLPPQIAVSPPMVPSKTPWSPRELQMEESLMMSNARMSGSHARGLGEHVLQRQMQGQLQKPDLCRNTSDSEATVTTIETVGSEEDVTPWTETPGANLEENEAQREGQYGWEYARGYGSENAVVSAGRINYPKVPRSTAQAVPWSGGAAGVRSVR